jgi:hypothetical protein
MRLLYPSDPFQKKKSDEAYEEEFNAAENAEDANRPGSCQPHAR